MGNRDIYKFTEITYKGTFRENKFEDGECTFNNETGEYVIKYSEGNIVDSLIKFSDGTVYTGQCSGTEIVGTGIMKYSNGDQYNGAFESGKRMEKEFIDGNPETNTMEIGLMIKWKVQEHIYILME